MKEGLQFSVGGKEVEIDRAVPRVDYLSGACFGRGPVLDPGPSLSSSSALTRKFVPLKPVVLNPSTTLRKPSAPATQSSSSSHATLSKCSLGSDPSESCWTVNW
jgi:DNA repair and recombination protein RAD54B